MESCIYCNKEFPKNQMALVLDENFDHSGEYSCKPCLYGSEEEHEEYMKKLKKKEDYSNYK